MERALWLVPAGMATRSDVTESDRGSRVYRGILRQGFTLAVFYCALGLGLELLHQALPAPIYERAASAIYGLPLRLLGELGLQGELITLVAHGKVPVWLAGAAVPAVGVGVILTVSAILAALFRFGALVRSFRQY